jgi:hypothetical protein
MNVSILHGVFIHYIFVKRGVPTAAKPIEEINCYSCGSLCWGWVVMIRRALVGLPGVVNCGDRGQAPAIVAGVEGYSSVRLEAVGKLVAVGTWRKNDEHCMKYRIDLNQ